MTDKQRLFTEISRYREDVLSDYFLLEMKFIATGEVDAKLRFDCEQMLTALKNTIKEYIQRFVPKGQPKDISDVTVLRWQKEVNSPTPEILEPQK